MYKRQHVTNNIVPEMNRIWAPAGIEWVVESILLVDSADIPNKQTLYFIRREYSLNASARSIQNLNNHKKIAA